MSDASEDDVSSAARLSLITYMYNVQISHHMAVAPVALWMWDVLITLGEEVKYVWQRKGLVIKTLYFLVSLYMDF
jgi:hypothetical protein